MLSAQNKGLVDTIKQQITTFDNELPTKVAKLSQKLDVQTLLTEGYNQLDQEFLQKLALGTTIPKENQNIVKSINAELQITARMRYLITDEASQNDKAQLCTALVKYLQTRNARLLTILNTLPNT